MPMLIAGETVSATLLTPRAIHRDGLHGARKYEAHAFDFIAEDAQGSVARMADAEVLCSWIW